MSIKRRRGNPKDSYQGLSTDLSLDQPIYSDQAVSVNVGQSPSVALDQSFSSVNAGQNLQMVTDQPDLQSRGLREDRADLQLLGSQANHQGSQSPKTGSELVIASTQAEQSPSESVGYYVVGPDGNLVFVTDEDPSSTDSSAFLDPFADSHPATTPDERSNIATDPHTLAVLNQLEATTEQITIDNPFAVVTQERYQAGQAIASGFLSFSQAFASCGVFCVHGLGGMAQAGGGVAQMGGGLSAVGNLGGLSSAGNLSLGADGSFQFSGNVHSFSKATGIPVEKLTSGELSNEELLMAWLAVFGDSISTVFGFSALTSFMNDLWTAFLPKTA